jgi:hypothetical protein
LIDVATSADRNVIKKEAKKILTYEDHTAEIHCTRNVKAKVMPVTTAPNGTISKSLRPYLSSVPGTHEIRELQHTATLGTAHTMYVADSANVQSGQEDITLHVAQTVNTEQLQHYEPLKHGLFMVYNCTYRA